MGRVFSDGVDGEAFLLRAVEDGYSMEQRLIEPAIGLDISAELKHNGYLEDLTELVSTERLASRGMKRTLQLHGKLNKLICKVENARHNYLPFFSVRVFEPGIHGTTIHRNHPAIGPYAVGVTLTGEAPFNVYEHDVLPDDEVRPLLGDGSDPVPMETMNADAGSAWTLYTRHELQPHASGLVLSQERRELLIFYGMGDPAISYED